MPSSDVNIFCPRANSLLAILTKICEILVVAVNARWSSVNCYKFLLWQGLVAVKTAEMSWMPVCIHGLRIFSNIDQLWKMKTTVMFGLILKTSESPYCAISGSVYIHLFQFLFLLNFNYSGTPILRYGKGKQNHIVKSGYCCKRTPDLTIWR